MAHSCPDCDSICHCGGDIDDCEIVVLHFIEDENAVNGCTHWYDCEDDDFADYFDEVEDD